MSDYISRQAAIEAITNTVSDGVLRDTIEIRVNDIPSADVIEVVRCKDCKHYETDGGALMVCEVSALNTNDDDYCSYGERTDT